MLQIMTAKAFNVPYRGTKASVQAESQKCQLCQNYILTHATDATDSFPTTMVSKSVSCRHCQCKNQALLCQSKEGGLPVAKVVLAFLVKLAINLSYYGSIKLVHL